MDNSISLALPDKANHNPPVEINEELINTPTFLNNEQIRGHVRRDGLERSLFYLFTLFSMFYEVMRTRQSLRNRGEESEQVGEFYSSFKGINSSLLYNVILAG